ncbi:hypothetical protein N7U66_03720 [Lacinutrix neustonica]|uniref:MerR family transcriptional regulator n=1 Tax=Lacinutrix neustonica TaxID=2980107 RepID=A0A9E8SE49_9FLAO|nr:chaperone modulator CbpM [Lacinutrix neustonica]WAC02781.1 hypothetical protein N7U66_03720 [Lacinutrix neustonica]
METDDLISIQQFCLYHNVPNTFIDSLHNYELIEIIDANNERYIKITQINDLERMMRLHFELDLNFESLDVVDNLLKQVVTLQNQIKDLKNRLRLYEDE